MRLTLGDTIRKPRNNLQIISAVLIGLICSRYPLFCTLFNNGIITNFFLLPCFRNFKWNAPFLYFILKIIETYTASSIEEIQFINWMRIPFVKI